MNRKFKIAAVLMLIHGALMEAATGIFMLPAVLLLGENSDIKQYIFANDFLQANLTLVMVMGIIFGILRIIGAIGVLKNRFWGFTLAFINCIITMILMMFMIPTGIMDGIFACTALVLLLMGYFGNREIKP